MTYGQPSVDSHTSPTLNYTEVGIDHFQHARNAEPLLPDQVDGSALIVAAALGPERVYCSPCGSPEGYASLAAEFGERASWLSGSMRIRI